MINDTLFVQKLIDQCQKNQPTQASLAACCKEILQNYKFDCVFIASSTSPEEVPVPLAYEGKEEIMDTCLYRLGVEERVTLSKLPIKYFLDMTGKPVFNKSGSLRIQKPFSGIFLAYHLPKRDFLLLGCAHQDSRPYGQDLLTDLTNVWKPWQESLLSAVHAIKKPGKVDAAQPGSTPKVQFSPEGPANFKQEVPRFEAQVPPVTTVKPEKGDKDHQRPVVLVDEVTRLFNKDYFEECLAIEVERAKRYSRHVSLLFLGVTPVDPVTAKLIEDTTATQVADILYKSLRRVDIICRLDKNRYGIILPDTDNQTYGIIAKRIFKFYKQIMGDAPPVFLNISASTYPKHAGNHLLLFENAEKLLSQAQAVGPNKAVLPE